ncbi:IDEAL domain-containing protein [Aneurinibacillus thermoaerophilus]|uniref:IDEAL domain-containing protein n=1 Tax=Aneurinibacillus thermoaerophilus TaxID=143495 RepID=A0ABX8YDE7_ANETH|nr:MULTISPECIES: IDEAL domain-containing protein [Paenibacillaceae]MED0759123.1 IDEAL domain-containing protein [Aneurinibacillus thermoaerophilus]MED0762709.1 IDEAL domain-containing protein [Aneurinibacillus thermoaerophilus]QYY43119.1 IDEAL domain-containing protein [Aneurinibacillus thermoaerophilus]
MSEFKEQMMMCSEDYNELIDMALAMKDKEWFEELVKRQKRLRELEVEMRRLLGVID